MEWTDETEHGTWIRERLDEPWRGTMHDVVPRGFAAYVRILHPATRDRPVGTAWPALPYAAHEREWEAFQRSAPQIDSERVSWAATAAALGTTMHATAQWHSLVAPGRLVEHEDGPRDAAGWRYGDPRTGGLEPDLLADVARTLAAHTSTPDDGFVALWEGWGGLLGFHGEAPSRTFFQLTGDAADAASPRPADAGLVDQHNAMLGRSIHDSFNTVLGRPTWQPGILSDEISRGARLSLPARDHVLFRGGVSELADPDWPRNVPWRDRESEEHGFAPSAESPSLVWPADRAWVLVSDVDHDSTVVAGSAELIRALCADPRLEALPLTEGTALTWDADEVNG